MLFASNFDHNPTRHTESKALLKSMKEQNSFNFFDFKISIRAWRT